MKNVLEWLEQTASVNPEKTAFSSTVDGQSEETKITFRQVEIYSKVIGTVLSHEQGQTPAAVFASRSAFTPALFAGVVYSGRAYAPIDASLPEARLEKILNNLSPSLIVADQDSAEVLGKFLENEKGKIEIPQIYIVDFKENLISCGERVWALDEAVIQEENLQKIRKEMIPTDPLYIIYTSGSSGNPKGVLTSHQSLINYINAYSGVMNIQKEDILGNQSPLDYIAAIRDIYLPFKMGCSTIIIPKQYFMEPNVLFQYMNEKGVTSVGWSVSALTVPLSLGAFEEVGLTTLKKICFSGSVMPCSALRTWQENIPDGLFVNQYGPTEATASCTYYVVDHIVSSDEVLPIGQAYEGYRVFLLETEGKSGLITEHGKQGEICISGPSLALGYYNDPERTANSFIQNPCNFAYPERIYRSGDYGSWDEEGILHYHGRMDRQIKHMGHRVELDEVECAAMVIPEVKECCCIYKKEKEALFLYYTGEVSKRELSLELRKTLPGFMVPRKLVPLDEMPKLPNGKIDMKKVEEM